MLLDGGATTTFRAQVYCGHLPVEPNSNLEHRSPKLGRTSPFLVVEQLQVDQQSGIHPHFASLVTASRLSRNCHVDLNQQNSGKN
jgi:hypothetical protein